MLRASLRGDDFWAEFLPMTYTHYRRTMAGRLWHSAGLPHAPARETPARAPRRALHAGGVEELSLKELVVFGLCASSASAARRPSLLLQPPRSAYLHGHRCLPARASRSGSQRARHTGLACLLVQRRPLSFCRWCPDCSLIGTRWGASSTYGHGEAYSSWIMHAAACPEC